MHPRKTMEVLKTIQMFKDIMLCRISFVVDQNWWYVVSVYIPGFPPIREFREICEDFFQSGKSGKIRGFSAKIREKNSDQGTFFQTIFKPFKPIN